MNDSYTTWKAKFKYKQRLGELFFIHDKNSMVLLQILYKFENSDIELFKTSKDVPWNLNKLLLPHIRGEIIRNFILVSLLIGVKDLNSLLKRENIDNKIKLEYAHLVKKITSINQFELLNFISNTYRNNDDLKNLYSKKEKYLRAVGSKIYQNESFTEKQYSGMTESRRLTYSRSLIKEEDTIVPLHNTSMSTKNFHFHHLFPINIVISSIGSKTFNQLTEKDKIMLLGSISSWGGIICDRNTHIKFFHGRHTKHTPLGCLFNCKDQKYVAILANLDYVDKFREEIATDHNFKLTLGDYVEYKFKTESVKLIEICNTKFGVNGFLKDEL
jgi:hypothetical protein